MVIHHMTLMMDMNVPEILVSSSKLTQLITQEEFSATIVQFFTMTTN
jgi:hypothetical protein